MSHERDKKSLLAVNLGLGSNIILAAVKTFFGVTGHSPALLAEGINSTSDVAYYVVASVFVRLANKPPDMEHPYGHRQLESIASVIVGSFVVTTAITVFWDSIDKMWDLAAGGRAEGASEAALWVALATVMVKVFLTLYANRLAQETQNPMVQALAFDHRNDLFSASAASVGIFLGQRGLPWVDPLAGALVALLILRTGIHILRESSVELMDAVPSQTLAEQIAQKVQRMAKVEQIQEIQAHRFGPHIVVNLTVGVDGHMSVREGDEIASQIESMLCAEVANVRRVHVHYHPSDKSFNNMTVEQILAVSRSKAAEPQEPV
jgi:cation diffusion facilitator family transporter